MTKLNCKTRIKTIWTRLKASRDCDPTKVTNSPARDWRRLLGGWFILLLVIFSIAAYLSWRINNLQVTLSPEEVATGARINPQLVIKAKKLIRDKAIRFAQNQQTLPVSIDPGL